MDSNARPNPEFEARRRAEYHQVFAEYFAPAMPGGSRQIDAVVRLFARREAELLVRIEKLEDALGEVVRDA